MEVRAYIKNIKISPKKLRFLLPEIKKLRPTEALDKLFYMPKKSAKIYYQAIKSAVNNAKLVLKTNEDLLKFKLLTVEEGRKLKRFQSGGRGTVKSILKRYSHIKIVLTVDDQKRIINEVRKSRPEGDHPLDEKPEVPNKLKIKKSKTTKSNKNGTKS